MKLFTYLSTDPKKMQKILIGFILIILITSTAASSNPPRSCNGMLILGTAERVILLDKNISLTAKIDTGADTSSLSATRVKLFQHNHKTWIQFMVPLADHKKPIVFTKPVIKYSRILKRSDEITANSHSTRQHSIRPVVALPIQLETKKVTILVNLIDRTQFQHPLLLGRDALKSFNVLIDVKKNGAQDK